MAAETIIIYKKPEFPKVENTENGTVTRIEYIGDSAILAAALPIVGASWGDYVGQVKSVSTEPTEKATVIEAFVTVEQSRDNTDVEPGQLVSISYEIRWVTVDRSMLEHPQFAIGGGGANALATSEIIEIEFWRAPENTKALKELYKYNASGYDYELGTNAKYFARGIELGQETYEDKAPIAVKISEYVNGPPPETTAGLKEDPVGFPNLPAGFEWRKETADSTRAGGALKWNLTEEWVGAAKVLTDRLNVYWDAPT